MNQDPKRLLLDPEVGDQLKQFDQQCQHQPFDLQAGLARFEAAAAAAPTAAAAASTTAGLGSAAGAAGSKLATSGAGALFGLKGLLAAGALAGAGALAWTFWPLSPSAPVDAPEMPSSAAPAQALPAPPVQPPSSEGTTSVKLKPDPLQAELTLVKKARQALAKHQARKALTLLQDSQETFANGALVPEREALLIIALHQSGQVRKARSRARRFLSKHPQSPMTNRIRQVLEKKAPRRRR